MNYPLTDARPIPGFEGYLVTAEGEVISLRGIEPRRLRPQRERKNYRKVSLRKDGLTYQRKVHRLVMAAHVGPCPEGHEVDHIDGDVGNNRLGNLRYVTPEENRACQRSARDEKGRFCSIP